MVKWDYCNDWRADETFGNHNKPLLWVTNCLLQVWFPPQPGPIEQHADLVPKNAPSEQFLATQICLKLSYQKLLLHHAGQYHAGTAAESFIIFFHIILITHLWHFLSQWQARSLLAGTLTIAISSWLQVKNEAFPAHGGADCSCRLDLLVSKPVLTPWLCSPMLQKARPLDQVVAVHLQASLRGFYSLVWGSHQSLVIPSSAVAISPQPSSTPDTHRKISTKALPNPNPLRLLPSKLSSGNCWWRQHFTCCGAKIQVCNN